jgi:hypothetical protein
MEDNVSWGKSKGSPSRGPHPDYNSNLLRAKEFCKNVESSLLQGMRVYITGSPELPESLLMICFTLPRAAQMGNFAAPVFLHQSGFEVSKQTEALFNSYLKMAKDFWNKEPKIIKPDFGDAVGQ